MINILSTVLRQRKQDFSNTLEDREESRMTSRFYPEQLQERVEGLGWVKTWSSHWVTSMRCLVWYPNPNVE